MPAPPRLDAEVEVDTLDDAAWSAVLAGFADANLYQTAAFGRLQSGGRVSRLVLRERGRVVCAAQLRIARLPWLPLGVAYLRWGPMWRRVDGPADPRHLQAGMEALRREYVERRGLCLRVVSHLPDDDPAMAALPAAWSHFRRVPAERAQRTLWLPLDAGLPELRARLEQKWRNGLNRAQRQGLLLQEGTEDALFERFEDMHRLMVARKQFVPGSDVADFRRVQRALPPSERMQVMLAWDGERPAAGLVCSHLGDTGIYLHAATTEAGLRTQAAYLLQWRAIEWLHGRGARVYNLHGIDPQANPGTYHFKAGLAGRHGRDLRYLGTFDATPSPVADRLMRTAQGLRRRVRAAQAALRAPGDSGRRPRPLS